MCCVLCSVPRMFLYSHAGQSLFMDLANRLRRRFFPQAGDMPPARRRRLNAGRRRRAVRRVRRPLVPRIRGRPMRRRLRKKRSIHTRVKHIGSRNNTFHRVVFGRRSKGVSKLIKKLSSKNEIFDNDDFLLVADAGNQNSYGVSLGTRSQLRALAEAMGQGGVAGGDGFVENTKRWVFSKQFMVLRMSNLSTASLTGWMAFYTTKHDTDYTINQLWERGINDEQDAQLGNESWYVGMVPFNNALVNTWYKLVKVVHFQLLPGEEHIEHIKYNANRMIQNELIYAAGVPAYLRGLTIHCLIGVYGSLGLNTVAASVTTAPVKLGIVESRNTFGSYLSDNDYNMTVTNNIATANDNINIYNMGAGNITGASTV